ncbi:hypothetical protein J2Z21_000590 [Streptomyces griseochromogenes]|uniref:DUF4267 domain-containing protein n=1 Tax=Streptomyces griseochromogenes TaxID=68214 RepID=A0A1B1B2E9_9ACTN|nr:hypothetical protein [Streptomyces griseochromogenes]ANP53005.1 hypothetical protein AVL59_28760 [Streptomyces griseochromogenes]MBP2047668.1 hypothetical protein [Streptomyces griseochromogenes]
MATAPASNRPVSVYLLAGIRLVNGAAGLLAPDLLIRRFDPDRDPPSPAAIYAFRLFGIRTILLGLDLLTHSGERLRDDLRDGILIHGSDTATAATLGMHGHVPPRTAVMTTLISAVNTALSVSATASLANSSEDERT